MPPVQGESMMSDSKLLTGSRPINESPRARLAPLSEPTEFDKIQPLRSISIYDGRTLVAIIEQYADGWYVFVDEQHSGPYPTRAAAFADVDGMIVGYTLTRA
jgi:hypothetical protein